jgi:hypothetical protein
MYAERHELALCANRRYATRHYGECHYTECRGAQLETFSTCTHLQGSRQYVG